MRSACSRPRAGLAGRLLVPLGIALVTLAAFAPALDGAFVQLDDDRNFVDNPHYRGLGWAQLRWMFTSAIMGHWTPVTWLTLGLDYVVWGMDPFGYHLTNLLLHAANAVLVYLIALRLIGAGAARSASASAAGAAGAAAPVPDAGQGVSLGAAAAALLFALHPLRVESVAWVTERRDVLSALFCLLAVLAYLAMAGAGGSRRRRLYLVSLAAYGLGLLSKSMLISLPFVLLVLDVYPLRRLGAGGPWWRTPAFRTVLLEKLPYLAMAIAVAAALATTMSAQVRTTSLEAYPPLARIAMAAHSLAFFPWKTLVPLDLAPMYELPARVSLLEPRFLASTVTVALATIALIAARRRWPAGLAAAAVYAIALAPVSGLVHAGPQLVADRFGYLPGLAPAVLLGAGVARAATLASPLGRLVPLAVAAWLAALAALTWTQAGVWKNTDTLLQYTIEVQPECSWCHNQWAAVLGNRGEMAPAIHHFTRAAALRPDRVGYHANIGLALLNAGRPAEAVPHLTRMLQAHPDNAEALTNLGLALIHLGRPGEAVPPLERAVAASPALPRARLGLARAHHAQGRADLAAEHQAALRRLDPRLAEEAFGLPSGTR